MTVIVGTMGESHVYRETLNENAVPYCLANPKQSHQYKKKTFELLLQIFLLDCICPFKFIYLF